LFVSIAIHGTDVREAGLVLQHAAVMLLASDEFLRIAISSGFGCDRTRKSQQVNVHASAIAPIPKKLYGHP
jgi:hypothetical protein